MGTTHEINVTSLDSEHRRALEDVIGMPLRHNQRLLINVTDAEKILEKTALSAQRVSDWAKVYEGLPEAEVEAIDQEINTRVNFTRRQP